MLQIILGVIRCIFDFQKPCALKTTGIRVKDTSRSLSYLFLCIIVFHLVKQSAKPLGFLLEIEKTMVVKVISEIKFISRLKICPKLAHLPKTGTFARNWHIVFLSGGTEITRYILRADCIYCVYL